jgi:hypothetical protein
LCLLCLCFSCSLLSGLIFFLCITIMLFLCANSVFVFFFHATFVFVSSHYAHVLHWCCYYVNVFSLFYYCVHLLPCIAIMFLLCIASMYVFFFHVVLIP